VPLYPGLFSAFGMLMTDLRQDFVRTDIRRLDSMGGTELTGQFSTMEEQARDILKNQNVPEEKILFHRYADMRYYGQEHTVKVPVPGGVLNPEGIDEIREGFHTLHARAYSFKLDAPVELVNFHLTAFGVVKKPEFEPVDGKGLSLGSAYKEKRSVNYDELGFHESRVYERDLIPLGEIIPGPVIIEEKASTTVVFPDQQVTRDIYGFLHIENT
jgi:N-methylhydantoinase A